RETGAEVEDAVIYDNVRVEHAELPSFDSVFFASASAVESFIGQWGAEALAGKTISVIGKPTANALEKHGGQPTVIAREATVPGAINALAEYFTGEELCSPKPD
ncbi:MAG: uroporphyrinogen-III synthase, partial [Verrucomicrobiota bacterium]